MIGRAFLLALTYCALVSVAHAQIKVLNFEELVNKEQLISGEGLVGAMVADARRAVQLDRIEINVPDGASGVTRIQVISADGTYVGTIRVSLDGVASGWQRLDALKSGHDAKFSKYKLDDLTFLAEGRGGKPLLVRLSQAPLGSVMLYINSEKSDAIIAYRLDGAVTSEPCRRLTGSKIRFDTICTAPYSVISNGPVRIIRSRDGAALAPLNIEIAVDK